MSQVISKSRLPLFEEYCRKNDIDGKTITCEISGIPVKLKVASTPESQARGYSDSLQGPEKDQGIIFVYDEIQPLSFWMRKVKFPLDIIFFDDDCNYINHHTMEPGHAMNDDKLPQYKSESPARFAVELPAGWCEKNMTSDCKLSF